MLPMKRRRKLSLKQRSNMEDLGQSYLSRLSQTELFQEIATICAAVNTVVSTNELLAVSLENVLKLFKAQRGSIFILNDKEDELELRVAVGLGGDEQKAIVKRMGEGFVGQVAQTKEPIIVDDIAQDKRFKDHKSKNGYKTSSFICAPLLLKDQLIGVINITDKDSGHKFLTNELQLLDFIASQIALNYRRIILYRKFQTVVKETQSLKDKLGETGEETAHLKKQIMIQEKLATIGKLAGGIAHEFNNPLDGVMRYTNLCLDQIQDDEVVRGYLMEIKQGLNRMAIIVRNLLRCSRDDVLSQEKVNLKSALGRALYNLQTDFSRKDIEIVDEVPDELPDLIDLGLERILVNLIRNAIDAIEEKGKISITAQFENDVLMFNVADNGIGIAQTKINEIFEPFYTTKDIDKGCGLGLTIIGEIVKSYDGKIDVESQPDCGTTFTVRIPLEREDNE